MVENLFEQNILWAVLTAVVWGCAARGARRLATRPAAALRRRARLGLALLTVALLTLAVRAGLALGLVATAGWLGGADYVLFGALPPVLAAVAVAALAVPAYLRVLRAAPAAGSDPDGSPLPPGLRALAAGDRLVVPVQACCATTLLGAAGTLHPPAPPYTGPFLVHILLGGAVCGGLLLLHRRRRAALEARGGRPVPRARQLVRATATVTGLAVLTAGGCTLAAGQSRLPDRTSASAHAHSGTAPTRSVVDLTGDRSGEPDRRFTLTATDRTLRLASGEKVAALSFNNSLPGPELRVRRGQLVEVVLVNRDVADGVTLHWHGVDVPNAEDGVAGVTQDAVPPGGHHVYRFRPDRAGTFWYHSHQQSSIAVARGLFGALVVEDPSKDQRAPFDRTVVAHAWPVGTARNSPGGPHGGGALSGTNGLGGTLRTAFGDDTRTRAEKVRAGTEVRLRLVNADNCPRTYSLAGTSFAVAAIDGTEVQGASEVRGRLLRVAGGGRYDLTYRQPDGPVRLTVVGDANASAGGQGFEGCGQDGAYGTGRTETASLLLASNPSAAGRVPAVSGPLFDPLHYGSAAGAGPLGRSPRFDRDFSLVLGNSLGFHDGSPMVLWTVNNAVHPDIPALVVEEGDLVRTTFLNRSLDDHPMHLHGHRMLVLSRDGEPATGSPWWTDTLNVAPGERYEVAFRSDNPGLWMDHCHNLDHARDGMVLHLAYDGVTSPYESGSSTGNVPE
ncbi:multicopper oxidase family protein [Streptomyces albidoflavus]|uniref:multicopper oxidase family protein n=1 Tax=Streptomyces albidoflavus TaxID=1886 RepID=UPI00332265ED